MNTFVNLDVMSKSVKKTITRLELFGKQMISLFININKN